MLVNSTYEEALTGLDALKGSGGRYPSLEDDKSTSMEPVSSDRLGSTHADGWLRQFGQNWPEEDYDADVEPASDVLTIAHSSTTFLGSAHHNEVGHHNEPSASFDQSHQDSAVRRSPLGFIDQPVQEHSHSTHIEPPHLHPIRNVVPSEDGSDEVPDRLGEGVQPMLANPGNPLRPCRESSAPHLRPLGPRGPLISYAQLYGEVGEGDTSSEEDSVEAESIDRCSEVTPPPPYEGDWV